MSRTPKARPEVAGQRLFLDGVAKNLADKLYGPSGPPPGTTFAEVEEMAVQVGAGDQPGDAEPVVGAAGEGDPRDGLPYVSESVDGVGAQAVDGDDAGRGRSSGTNRVGTASNVGGLFSLSRGSWGSTGPGSRRRCWRWW